jgi:ribosome biogenesis GTPase
MRDTSDVAVRNGFVIRIQGADYYVLSADEEIRCILRGRFRIADSPEMVLPVVGDDVAFRFDVGATTHEPRGLITAIQPRRSVFARSGGSGKRRVRIIGANFDRVILVFSATEPKLNLRLVDRMLVAAECGGMEPVLVVNKLDLVSDVPALEALVQPYRDMDYRVILTSAATGTGIDFLEREMRKRRSIMVGPSGTGKTSIVATLEPGLELKVGKVSGKTKKGIHTTTHIELHPLSRGGFLGDTPGVREFGIWGVSRGELDRFFRDFEPFRDRCRFSGCTHSHEPGCAVKDAVSAGAVSAQRHDSYQRILATLPRGADR